MSCRIIIPSAEGNEQSFNVSWKVAALPLDQPFQSADVILHHDGSTANFTIQQDTSSLIYLESAQGERHELQAGHLGHPDAFRFLVDALNAVSHAGHEGRRVGIKLVAPSAKGNIIRADILRQRMQDTENVEETATFARPLQVYDGQPWTAETGLVALFAGSAGAIRLRSTTADSTSHTLEESLLRLERTLYDRLPTPLAIPGLRRRTLAFLEGSELLPNTGGCAQQFYSAAESLGIDVVVLGVQGHWLQGIEYSHWRKTFIPIEFGHDDDFPTRIVTALKTCPEPIEALLTCFDSYHVAVSQAAAQLGLPHEPTAAYEIATNKFKLSAFEGRRCFRVASVDDAVSIARTEQLPYPVIIKPCRGWGSELVFRVENLEELLQVAEHNTSNSASHGAEFVIEPYCDGPEVDINFVLYDGEVLFWEIGDENPKIADNGANSFHELDCVSPSALPQKEQLLLRDSIADSLLKLGFRNGIYHCEARIENSTYEWKITESGVPVLLPRAAKAEAEETSASASATHPKTPEPSSFLIDCNIRPPGLNSSDIIETTWGIDYWALLLTIPLHDTPRTHALSQPYRTGPQYFADMIFISATTTTPTTTFPTTSAHGIWDCPDNLTDDMIRRRPDLARNISKALTYKRRGDVILHPSSGTNTFVAYVNVFSRESREHCLRVATEVRREVAGGIRIL